MVIPKERHSCTYHCPDALLGFSYAYMGKTYDMPWWDIPICMGENPEHVRIQCELHVSIY